MAELSRERTRTCDSCGKGGPLTFSFPHNAHFCAECDRRENGWQAGDPCASCGSTDTGYAYDTGAFCNGCGATDADA